MSDPGDPTTHGAASLHFYVDWGKLLVILTLLGGVTGLGAVNQISQDTVTGVYFAAAGYVFGNGRLAARGLPVSPLVAQGRSLTRPPVPVVENDRRFDEGKKRT